ncbi:hypothetical protein [Tepidibacter sp. Z1-5]
MSQVSKIFKISTRILRYYEGIGLILKQIEQILKNNEITYAI